MAVLFASNEVDPFEVVDSSNVLRSSNAVYYDSDYQRSATTYLRDGGQLKAHIGSTTEGWVHFVAGRSNQRDTQQDDPWFYLIDGGNGALRFSQTNGLTTFQRHDGTVYVDFGEVYSPANEERITIDIHYNIAVSTGFYRIYINGHLFADTGAVSTSVTGRTEVDEVWWASHDWGTTGPDANAVVTEVIIADECTIDWRCANHEPTAAGTNTAWTGTYTDVDDDQVADDSTTEISSTTATDVETNACANLSTNAAADATRVIAVVTNTRAEDDGSAPTQLQHVIRSNGADYNGATHALPATYATAGGGQFTVWATDPDTGSAWTTSAIDAMEIGVESIT